MAKCQSAHGFILRSTKKTLYSLSCFNYCSLSTLIIRYLPVYCNINTTCLGFVIFIGPHCLALITSLLASVFSFRCSFRLKYIFHQCRKPGCCVHLKHCTLLLLPLCRLLWRHLMRLTSFCLRLHTVSQRKCVQPLMHVSQAIQNVNDCVFAGLKSEGESRVDSVQGQFMSLSGSKLLCPNLSC